MSNVRKVFIYNAPGIGDETKNDLKTLFSTSEKIFSSAHDVCESTFDFNMNQLSHPIFVVPGGSTNAIAGELKKSMDVIKSHFKEDYSYVGVCAGAYLGAADAALFLPTNEPDFPFIELLSTKDCQLALNIIDDYQAIGAFNPDMSYSYQTPKQVMPYQVSISFDDHSSNLSQLYLGGPAFVSLSMKKGKSSTEVIANYLNHSNFNLPDGCVTPDTSSLPAMVRKLPQKNQGGKLLAATHIEACVQGSQLLSFLKTPRKDNAELNAKAHDVFVKEQQLAQQKVEEVLRETLKIIP